MNPKDFRTLASHVEGPVLQPGDEGYEQERTGFNLAVQHRPDVIVGATRAEDVQAAVRFAAEYGLPVAVQATGHGYSVAAEGGLLITTGRMSGVEVDPAAKTVTVEAGVRFEQVIPETAPHGLAPLNGSAPHVGVVPYVLGGGIGLLVRSFGYAADQVRSMDVVTADGSLRHVTPDSEPDLYWALLGGRDNFGIVTRLEMGLVPVARLYGGGLFYDAEAAPDVLQAYLRWTAGLPQEMNSSVALIPMPDDEDVPEPMRGRHIYHVRIAFTGSQEEGERLVAPLRETAGPVLFEMLREMPYAESASIHDDPPVAVPFLREVALFEELGEDALATILKHAGPQAPVPCVVELRHLGGALAAAPAHPNAVAHREAQYLLSVVTLLFGVTEKDTRPVLKGLFDALEPWNTGSSLNFMGHGENAGPEQVRTAYAPEALQRLGEIKASHDPENLFRLNYNIAPTGNGAATTS
ncbi:FAD-binding oxidoreductase [Streptomyces tubercidicus]|uniref:Oxidoreductase n=1 Tax=Streptomyces tubercidicus TaxID=47759 RepID=A0A640UWH7_9ACTN|nr:FAD-binding oxidoreductase [Streptomyces tubercidicus]WAU14451.1 FAD-binding oxidoreductase [Streptomyces tubercidicus]GFE40189.1 oxidoreductase [Streptomyces tubercidicus]